MLLFDHQQHIAAILLIAIFRQTTVLSQGLQAKFWFSFAEAAQGNLIPVDKRRCL